MKRAINQRKKKKIISARWKYDDCLQKTLTANVLKDVARGLLKTTTLDRDVESEAFVKKFLSEI